MEVFCAFSFHILCKSSFKMPQRNTPTHTNAYVEATLIFHSRAGNCVNESEEGDFEQMSIVHNTSWEDGWMENKMNCNIWFAYITRCDIASHCSMRVFALFAKHLFVGIVLRFSHVSRLFDPTIKYSSSVFSRKSFPIFSVVVGKEFVCMVGEFYPSIKPTAKSLVAKSKSHSASKRWRKRFILFSSCVCVCARAFHSFDQRMFVSPCTQWSLVIFP